MSRAIKKIRYAIEAILTLLIYVVLRVLPLPVASGFTGWVARRIGPKTKVHQVALQNMMMAMPELNADERERALVRMWDNLGRVFGEYAHLSGYGMKRAVEKIHGLQHLKAAIDDPRPLVIVSGHLGNWELPPVIAAQHGAPMHLLYRPANNPIVDWLISLLRKPYSLGLYAKGMSGARGVVQAISKGEPVAMLVDQKTNDAISVPFFGIDAMTTSAAAQFALKYDAIILPVYCRRKQGVAFEIQVDAPMEFATTGDADADALTIMSAVNAHLESWIRNDPAQWFWVHKRWPQSKAFAKPQAAQAA